MDRDQESSNNHKSKMDTGKTCINSYFSKAKTCSGGHLTLCCNLCKQINCNQQNRAFVSSHRSVIMSIMVLSLLILQTAAEPELLKRQFSASLYSSPEAPLPQKAPISQFPVSVRCKVKCKSPKQRPFCASDGKTYSSKCELRRVIKCEKKDIKIVSKGRCGVTGKGSRGSNPQLKCPEERARLLTGLGSNNTHSSINYIPTCHPNGSYKAVQCYKAPAYCWCVTAEGKPIPRTSVKGQKPNCNQAGRKTSKKRRGAQKRKCGRKEREIFTAALVKIFEDDYSRIPAGLSKENEKGDDGSSVDVIAWKYNELDRNKDGLLKSSEIKSLSRMTRKQVQPKVCAKRFPKYCDTNKNKAIDIDEWSECLRDNDKMISPGLKPVTEDGRTGQGTRNAGKKPGGGIEFPTSHSSANRDNQQSALSFLALLGAKGKTGPSLVDKQPGQGSHVTESRPEMPETQPSSNTDCFEARRQEEENEKTYPKGQIFVPECVDGGLYKKEQCHKYTGYCWCVDEKTGKPIPGYSTHNETPDCSQAKPERELKGCPYLEKRQYLTEVLDVLSKEMVKYADQHPGDVDKIPMDPNHSFEERAVRWKFKMLDGNKNQKLDRKETKTLKDVFKVNVKSQGQPSLRKCARNFLRYCDEDSDGKITIAEWVECLKLNELPREESEHKKRKGTNPLTHYLKSS